MADEIDLDDLIKRVVAMEEEALGLRALDVLADKLDQTPYMTNGLGPFTYESGSSDSGVYNVRMRLIIGHVTEGYKGQSERVLRKYIPLLQAFFRVRPGLTSQKFPDTPPYMSAVGAFLTGGVGTGYFQEPNLPMQVGTEFSLRVPCEGSIAIDVDW